MTNGHAEGIDAGESEPTADELDDDMAEAEAEEKEEEDDEDKDVGAKSSIVTDARLCWLEAMVTSAGRRDRTNASCDCSNKHSHHETPMNGL